MRDEGDPPPPGAQAGSMDHDAALAAGPAGLTLRSRAGPGPLLTDPARPRPPPRRSALPAPAQAALLGASRRWEAEAVEQPQRVVVEEAAEILAADVEGRHRRQQGGAGQDQAPHVLDVD